MIDFIAVFYYINYKEALIINVSNGCICDKDNGVSLNNGDLYIAKRNGENNRVLYKNRTLRIKRQ